MREIDAHFDAYEHLKHLPREAEALHMLRKAASMVKPMMRKRGWKVGTLAEFLPDEPQLLGRHTLAMNRALLLSNSRSQHQPHREDPHQAKISP
jgi:hypothetical protein